MEALRARPVPWKLMQQQGASNDRRGHACLPSRDRADILSILIPVAAVAAAALIGICLVAFMGVLDHVGGQGVRGRRVRLALLDRGVDQPQRGVRIGRNRLRAWRTAPISPMSAARDRSRWAASRRRRSRSTAASRTCRSDCRSWCRCWPRLAAGAFWGAIAGVLKVKAGTNEVISTLLLSFIAIWMVYWSVQSEALLRRPMTTSATLPESLEIPESTQLPLLTGDYSFPLHIGMPIAIVIAIIVAIALEKTIFGTRLRAVGLNPVAAQAGRHFLRTNRHHGACACRRARRARRLPDDPGRAVRSQGRLLFGLWL